MKKFLLSLFAVMLPLFNYAQEAEVGLDQKIDQAFQPVSDFFSAVIFFEIAGTPFVLLLLVGSAAFFTIYFGFPNIRYFGKAINTVRGKYDDIEGGVEAAETSMTVDGDIRDTIRDESEEGEVSHFQALATAVSEVLSFSGLEAAALDVAFFRAEDPAAARLARVGLRFELPKPEPMAQTPGHAPGLNPDKPPRLR